MRDHLDGRSVSDPGLVDRRHRCPVHAGAQGQLATHPAPLAGHRLDHLAQRQARISVQRADDAALVERPHLGAGVGHEARGNVAGVRRGHESRIDQLISRGAATVGVQRPVARDQRRVLGPGRDAGARIQHLGAAEHRGDLRHAGRERVLVVLQRDDQRGIAGELVGRQQDVGADDCREVCVQVLRRAAEILAHARLRRVLAVLVVHDIGAVHRRAGDGDRRAGNAGRGRVSLLVQRSGALCDHAHAAADGRVAQHHGAGACGDRHGRRRVDHLAASPRRRGDVATAVQGHRHVVEVDRLDRVDLVPGQRDHQRVVLFVRAVGLLEDHAVDVAHAAIDARAPPVGCGKHH